MNTIASDSVSRAGRRAGRVARFGPRPYARRVRVFRVFRLAAFAILIASSARAQHGRSREPRWREPRPRPPTHADSLRTLAGRWQVWGHGGGGWLGSPSNVRPRYGSGFDVGASADRRFADRIAVRARLDYDDLPSTQPSVVYVDGIPYSVNIDYGHGWLGSALGEVAVRAWNHVWLDGGAGGGYFESGFPSGQTSVRLPNGRTVPLRGTSGSGGVWSVGARYEFKPTLRDRLLAELQFYSMDRGGTTLRFWAIRAGYRAF